MTPNQPYLLKAFYDWIVDNQLTPYIVVDATMDRVDVPQEFVKDGQIVLNVSPAACMNFTLDIEALSFQARFGGQPRQIYIPCHAVLAVYARENGAGTVFSLEEETEKPDSPAPQSSADGVSRPSGDTSDGDSESAPVPPKKGKPNLKVIK
ncbi:ClpXP protease specificity-enhancing factor [Alteromonas sp. C1M14]|uniref:ClpXP protease specificity-enhancing factor n=1 Tax=Alteromonas sp. C1M14 TaxID=2841567 RepID=UPI001C0A2CED|nr:ClpXP protease specificity-enhancing factor [Alteromonas sp. C1M14]MBU2977678.1 ClpXP protease specificity-enhancing factor [Alteromonas sp. C1M14]